ncbi:MAG: 5'-3' exonuclease, partial [Aquificae bacterium]|nr:5'-3' exonuclease [Aquificota bacterium]
EKIYTQYKKQRPKAPDPLKVQIPVIKELLKLSGIPTLEKPGYEADDIIAGISQEFQKKDFYIKIYTPDKDLLQLVSQRVIVVNPMTGEVFTPKKVEEKFGVPPEKLADYLALVGDKVDNIPGLKGVGKKTALSILKTYGSVEEILKRWEEFSRKFPRASKEELEMSYKLVKLYTDAELKLTHQELQIREPDLPALKEKLRELEMKSLITEAERVFKAQKQGSLF